MTSVCCYGIKHKFSSEEIPTSKVSMTFNFCAVLKPNLLDVMLCTHQTQTNHKFLLSRTRIRIYVHRVEDILQRLLWCIIIWKVKSYNEGCSKVKEACQYKSFHNSSQKARPGTEADKQLGTKTRSESDQNSVFLLNIQLTLCFLFIRSTVTCEGVPLNTAFWEKES